MTKDVTTSLRELVEKASPLPWKTGMAFPTRVISGEGDARKIVAGTCLPLDEGAPNDIELNDAALIVAAVNALPGLLDENDELLARALSAEGEVQTLKDHIVALLAARERELKADEAVELLKERGCTRTELERAVHVTLEAMAHASAVEALARLSIGKGNGEVIPEGKQPPQSGPGAVAPATFGQVKP